MKVIVLACAMLLASSAAFAQAQPAGQAPMAAVSAVTVDFGAVMTNTKEGQAAVQKMQATFDPRRKQIADEAQALAKLKKELDPNLKGPKFKEAQAREQKLVNEDQALRRDIAQAQAQLLAPLREKVLAAIVAFAREKGIHQVHDRNALIYADPMTDITAEMIRRLDAAAK